MKTMRLVYLIFLSSLMATSLFGQTVTSSKTAEIHEETGSGTTINGANYYATGNDDGFAEYGIATFNLSNSAACEINSATLQLTVNDRSFTDGDMVEVFFTPDTEVELGTDFANLSYDISLVNGINSSHFTTAPISLGTYAFPDPDVGGTVLNYTLDLTTVGPAMLSAIQNGEDFQIIIGAIDASHDITFTGLDDLFEEGGQPKIAFDIEELCIPTMGQWSLFILGLSLTSIGLVFLHRYRLA